MWPSWQLTPSGLLLSGAALFAALAQVSELEAIMRSAGMPWPGDEGEERWDQAWHAITRVCHRPSLVAPLLPTPRHSLRAAPKPMLHSLQSATEPLLNETPSCNPLVF